MHISSLYFNHFQIFDIFNLSYATLDHKSFNMINITKMIKLKDL